MSVDPARSRLLARGLAAGLRTVSLGTQQLSRILSEYASPVQHSAPSTEPKEAADEPRWMTWSRWELGQSEVPGPRHNPRILEYWRIGGLVAEPPRGDETPWCSAFANAAMVVAGVTGTGSAMARSWMGWGKPLDEPVKGCVAVLWRGDRQGRFGHVGFYDSHAGEGQIRILGGNQRDRLSFQLYPLDGAKMGLLGYRWPEEKDVR